MVVMVLIAAAIAVLIVVIRLNSERPAVAAPRRISGLRLAGEGDFDFDVVGESHYQAVLSEICGGPCEDGHELEITAVLVPETDNEFDAKAVAVKINGSTVAYLSRSDAREYRTQLAAGGHTGQMAACDAMIVGGWSRQRRDRQDEGSFGVKLDLAWPIEVERF
jgi:hypothetical protein